MPLYYFVLKVGSERFPDTDGVELPDETAARAHAISIARELMRNQDLSTNTWRFEICDDYLNPCCEILFAEANNELDHLLPEYRETIESASRRTMSLQDEAARVYKSLEQVMETFARLDALTASVSFPPPVPRGPSPPNRE